MQITIELSDEQIAELEELGAIKQLSREALAAYAVQDYLDQVRLPRVVVNKEKLAELLASMDRKRAESHLAKSA